MTRIVGECRDFAGFKEFMRQWFLVEMATTFESIDEIAGLPQRYTAKLFGRAEVKSVGVTSLGPLLAAGGLKLQFVVDDEALARIMRHSRLKRRAKNAPFSKNPAMLTQGLPTIKRRRKSGRKGPHYRRGDSEWGRIMRARATVCASDSQRSHRARRAALVRWKAHRDYSRKAKAIAQRATEQVNPPSISVAIAGPTNTGNKPSI